MRLELVTRLFNNVKITKEQLNAISIKSLESYVIPDVVFQRSLSTQEKLVFGILLSLSERQEELQYNRDSIKYNLNIKGIPCEEDEEYVEIYTRLQEVSYLLSKFLP